MVGSTTNLIPRHYAKRVCFDVRINHQTYTPPLLRVPHISRRFSVGRCGRVLTLLFLNPTYREELAVSSCGEMACEEAVSVLPHRFGEEMVPWP